MRVELTFRPDRSAPALARGAATRRLRGRVSAPLLDDLRLVVTELVTNAGTYGPGRPVRVRLTVESPIAVRGASGCTSSTAWPGGGGVYESSAHVWSELASEACGGAAAR